MDVIFKIAGWIILIVVALIALTALINAWPDIELAISNFFSWLREEDEDEDEAEAALFKRQVSDILEYKGHYDPKQKLRVYSDNKITIYEDKRITWKSKAGNPQKDCIEYVNKLYNSCSDDIKEKTMMSSSIQDKARQLLAGSEDFYSGKLHISSEERSCNIEIYVANQLVFGYSPFNNNVFAHRSGNWEKELDRLYKKRLEENKIRAKEIAAEKAAKEEKEKLEKIRNFSPIDDSAYF